MTIRIAIKSRPARAAVMMVALAGFLVMAFAILRGFVTGVLADDRVDPRIDALSELAQLVPNDARVQAKLAEREFEAPDRDLKSAETQARKACELSPWNSQYWSLLASIEDAAGEEALAISALESSSRLAPNNSEIRWRLANALVRAGRIPDAAAEFKSACAESPDMLPAAIDTMWQASGQSAEAVIEVTPEDATSQMNLAAFLLSKSQVITAVNIFERVPRRDRLTAPVTPSFIDWLMKNGRLRLAKRVWAEVTGTALSIDADNLPLLSNGGFETKVGQFGQFNWQLSSNKYAEIGIDSTTARSGTRSLRVAFKRIDTTVLDQQVSQLVVLRPGQSYTVEWYVKAVGLSSPEGPRIVVTNATTGEVLSESGPIRTGSYDWEPGRLDVTAPTGSPDDGVGVIVSVRRKPKFSYDEPTSGTIWFDDFAVTGQQASS